MTNSDRSWPNLPIAEPDVHQTWPEKMPSSSDTAYSTSTATFVLHASAKIHALHVNIQEPYS